MIDYKITEEDFPGAKAFICMHSHKRKSQANYNPEAQYFISSADNIQLIMEAIDNRWSIESGLHWWNLHFALKFRYFSPFTPTTKYILQPVYFLVISPEKFKDLILLLVENIKYTVPIFAN